MFIDARRKTTVDHDEVKSAVARHVILANNHQPWLELLWDIPLKLLDTKRTVFNPDHI